jgi:hypothetical protein
VTTSADVTTSLETITAQLQRRIARLLLRHDRRTFRGRFRELYARSKQPQPDILRAYDRFARLIGLADELFDDILPRIRRQLSFSATRLELDEEPPLRGQIDWRQTIQRASATYPDQPPLRFATTLRSRSFATPENRMVVAILLRYAQLLAGLRSDTLFADAPLTTAEQREIIQLEDRVRRELATPQFQDLARDAEAADAADLAEQVSRRIRGGVNPYGDLITWWQRIEQQHLQTHTNQTLSPVLQAQEQAGLLYQLWIALELVNMLVELDQLSDPQIATDNLRFQFQWRQRSFVLVYDRSPKQHLAWTGAPGERPDYFITRANPHKIEDDTKIYWQEPGVLLDAKCYLGVNASRASGAIKRMLADIQLVDAKNGALIFPDITGLEPEVLPDTTRYLSSVAADSAVHLYAMRPFEQEVALHARLADLLDQVAAWLPERPPIVCHGCLPDRDTVTPAGRIVTTVPLIFCPKPHISPTHVDMVSPIDDCLKNPQVCHIMSLGSVAGLTPPFVERVLNQDELLTAIDQLRAHLNRTISPTDESEEAEQARSTLVEAIGRLVDNYREIRQPDTRAIEGMLEVIFGLHWSDSDDPRGLPEDVRNMLISGEFVYYEFEKGGVVDWAASAVQYVRAVERELHRRLYDRFGQPSPLHNFKGKPLKPHHFTFGTVSTAYHGRNHGSHNWQVFLNRAVTTSGSRPSTFEQVIDVVVGLHQLRNQIAHSEKIDQTKAQHVREITLGNAKKSLASALKDFIALLDV